MLTIRRGRETMDHAKKHGRRVRRGCALAAACALLATAFAPATAPAKTVELTKYDGAYPAASFDGSDAVGAGGSPEFTSLEHVDIDQVNDFVYVGSNSLIYKFDLAGVSQPFSGLGGNTVFSQASGFYGDVEVDNSGTATQGNIYVSNDSSSFFGYAPAGTALPGFPVANGGETCGLAVGPDGHIWAGQYPNTVREFDPSTTPPTFVKAIVLSPATAGFCDFDMDTQGNFLVPNNYSGGAVYKYNPTGTSRTQINSATSSRGVAVDPSNDDIYVAVGSTIAHHASTGGLIDSFGLAEGAFPGLQNTRGLAIDEVTHRAYVANKRSPNRVDTFAPTGAITIPDVTTSVPDVDATSAVLRGIVNGDGVDTTDCQFQWGTTSNYGNSVECSEGKVFTGASGDNNVSVPIAGLTKGTTYHFRLTAKNANDVISNGADREFTASAKPLVVNDGVSKINTDGVQFNVSIDPNGGSTHYHVDWGLEAGVYGNTFPEPDGQLESKVAPESFSQVLTGLSADTVYHYRVVAENDAGVTEGPDRSFRTFPPPPPNDPCPNALVRKQTAAALLSDCRAYELVSAADQSGYDVESDLIGGQTPLKAYPRASDRLLYSLHHGALADADNPTNFGHDPYVASRGETAWSSEYVGLPANGMPSAEPYGSPLLGANAGLDVFGFGGSGICDPCFADTSTNIPLRLSDGSLVEGMAGSLDPGPADPVGQVDRPFSDDGSHFIFGSDKKFESAGNNGSVSIYDRNLTTGTTQVVSTLPGGATMTGAGIAQLDISADGSRVLIGRLVSTDVEGNQYFDLYMHVGTNPSSVAVADTPSGVLYNGMTGDGTMVYFTTTDVLAGDGDGSPDLFRADVGTTSATVSRVSSGSGGTGQTDACTPITDWNVASGGPNCGTLAFSGGAGVASEDGTVYFLSPEKLDGAGNGVQDQPNLYVVRPGQSPDFVGTMDSSLTKPGPQPPEHPVVDNSFGAVLGGPAGMTVDQSNGDVYVPELSTGKVHRFKSDGTPRNFTAGPDIGTNTLTGFTWAFGAGTAQVAVDNSPGPAQGAIYVIDASAPLSTSVKVYAPSGALLTTLTGTGTASPFGTFALACGVAVDQSNGSLYVGDYFGFVWRYTPAAAIPVEADYSGAIEGEGFDGTCNVGADDGDVYLAHVEGEKNLTKLAAATFALGPPPKPAQTLLTAGVTAVATDPANGDVYANQGNKVTVFNQAGAQINVLGGGSLTASVGVAVNSETHHVYATTNGANVVEIGYVVPLYRPINNPAITHAVEQAGTHSFGDFQASPDGRFAAFSSTQPLNGAVTKGRYAIFRYDADESGLDCISCGPSSSADVLLTPTGLNLTDDGRVFFTSSEQYVLRDTNEKKDAYEWDDGLVQIISSGTSPADSGLLSVSADGVDAFFFTRDTLTPFDKNGSPMKIYTARENGGFLYTAPPFPCAASDECHGPSTQAAPPPNIDTVEGSGRSPVAQPLPKRCRRGFVKRNGKCVKKKQRKQQKKRAHRNNKGSSR